MSQSTTTTTYSTFSLSLFLSLSLSRRNDDILTSSQSQAQAGGLVKHRSLGRSESAAFSDDYSQRKQEVPTFTSMKAMPTDEEIGERIDFSCASSGGSYNPGPLLQASSSSDD